MRLTKLDDRAGKPHDRYVVGTFGSGKTALARKLVSRVDARHVEQSLFADDQVAGMSQHRRKCYGVGGLTGYFARRIRQS